MPTTLPPQERTKWFGRLGAAFGVGLIAGPAIGGFAGQFSPHLPFVIAAILNACSFVVIWLIFKNKNAIQNDQNETVELSVPFIQLIKPVILLLFVFFMAQLIGQIPATTWVLFTENRFQWNSVQVGYLWRA
ncbi:Metal-tetracycline/H(+) antiporter [Providencia rettgeri]|uniref:Metal-tetracycline/H(+) antiporter n=1 Tax=Providencia rettgeri TaxID=587 RepID=A0A379FVZ5_PRORE|nr:Metal-tetracycline/H(+) antiporter [Providencia rettgeri]